MYYSRFESELCPIILAGDDEGLKFLHLDNSEGKRHFVISPDWERNDSFFVDTIRQLQEYFKGERRSFNVKLAAAGTDFQKTVWSALQEIPYGEVRSYGEIASQIGKSSAARAVGMANGRNPIPVIIPCHRVIGSSGKLTGYAHGLAIKRELLDLEK